MRGCPIIHRSVPSRTLLLEDCLQFQGALPLNPQCTEQPVNTLWPLLPSAVQGALEDVYMPATSSTVPLPKTPPALSFQRSETARAIVGIALATVSPVVPGEPKPPTQKRE